MSDLLTRLGAAVLLSREELWKLIQSAPYRYKVYQIPKRKPGQFRTIAQPAKEVKILQRWVMKHVLGQFEVHQAAKAYRKDVSILDNATPHASARYLLKMDFEDFFPSLKAHDFRTFLKRQRTELDADEIGALCSILFWMPKGEIPDWSLSIGAPSSPMLSNILMADFDRRLSLFCAARQVTYTRYADDLSFSARESERLMLAEQAVIDWCAKSRSPRLVVNQSKTVRVSKREARRVTGLVLTNDRKVSLGREAKRRIRAGMHHFVTGQMLAEDIPKLGGMLAYVNSVEPSFIRRLRKKYGNEAVRRCLHWKSK